MNSGGALCGMPKSCMDKNWILADFESAIEQLDSALAEPAAKDIIKAGCIQYFEFSFELAWKSIKVVSGSLGQADCLSPKGCLKQGFTNGWINSEEIWLEMLQARNAMSHTYNARHALKIYASLGRFLPELKSLLKKLKSAT